MRLGLLLVLVLSNIICVAKLCCSEAVGDKLCVAALKPQMGELKSDTVVTLHVVVRVSVLSKMSGEQISAM